MLREQKIASVSQVDWEWFKVELSIGRSGDGVHELELVACHMCRGPQNVDNTIYEYKPELAYYMGNGDNCGMWICGRSGRVYKNGWEIMW
jgi:uncharacterized protein YbaR (Trm112 family)